jgi:AcrR family transcriptional regulator
MNIKNTNRVDNNSGKRGDATRQALIAAGLELFGEYGLKGTSTRMLSKQSGVNISAIPYYFGNKEGLYKAVVEYIIKRISVHAGDVIRELTELISKDSITPALALEALKKLLSAIARLMIESDEPKTWARIVVREQANPTQAYDIFYEKQIKQIQFILTQLISAYTGVAPERDEVKILGHAFFGQILGFLIARENILRHLGVKVLTEKHVQTIHRILLTNVENCLKIQP